MFQLRLCATPSHHPTSCCPSPFAPSLGPTQLKLCNFIDWKNLKLVYKRYASLYFIAGVDPADNELLTLEVIHHFVEVLDR